MPGAGTDRGRVVLRALMPIDASAARALIVPELERLGYSEGPRSALEAVVAGRDADSRGLVAIDAEHVVGCIIFGSVAGAVETGRIQLLVVAEEARRRGIATRLTDDAIAELTRDGNRVIFVELPDDPALAPAMRLLVRSEFHVDARVANYFRDGVDLAILRRDLRPGGERK